MQYLTAKQMRLVDEIAVKHGLLIIQMMENAGYQMASFIRKQFPDAKKILCLAGKGGNGGDALAAARHLINWGYEITCILSSKPRELKNEPLQQYLLLTSISADIRNYVSDTDIPDFLSYDLIIDGLLGYSITGDPRMPINEFINAANQSKKPVIAYDIPSGMDATTGETYKPTIRANATLTLALPKTCFKNKKSRIYTGEVYVADIAIPKKVYETIGMIVDPLFSKKSVVRLKYY